MKTFWLHFLDKFIHARLFGVCEHWAKHLGLKVSKVRVYFIYFSFLTVGSPILLYLVWAFWLEQKHFLLQRKRSIWDF